MRNSYSITVRNDSNQCCWYTFFAEKPQVSGSSPDIYPTALHSLELEDGMDGTFHFTDEFSALWCTSSRNEYTNSSVASIAKTISVNLSADDASLQFELRDRTVPDINRSSGGVQPGCFRIQTGGGFERFMTQQFGILVGVGINVDGQSVPMALWHPGPREDAQVRPVLRIHVARGQSPVGQLLDPRTLGKTCVADFSGGGRKDFQAVHTKYGELVAKN